MSSHPTGPRLFDAELFTRCLSACIADRRVAQADVAAEAGVSQGTVSTLLRGVSLPSIEGFARICHWMRMPIALFFRGPDGPKQLSIEAP